MSQANFLNFLRAVRDSPAMLAQYNPRSLSQLLFHAKNEGFHFTAEDIGEVIGKLEVNVIASKDHDPIDGTSRLWREMWGRYHLEYIVNNVVRRHSDTELASLIPEQAPWGNV